MAKPPECPRCHARMQRTYLQSTDDHKHRAFVPVGWLCTNVSCNFHSCD